MASADDTRSSASTSGTPPMADVQPVPGDLAAGDHIGAYRLLQRIGEGGFGVVFIAEQEWPIRRRVALKVIKPGMDTREVIARFEAERQALAMMGHPGVAAVYDAGATAQGRPYFVMEYVQGAPLTDYCDKNRLPIRARLELLVEVCGALQHAHVRGIIHRDLKPANILVTELDGRPVPKVIDFGIAKATNQRLTEKTIFTEQGRIIGTPEYMSPEQAEMTGLDVDGRTDVYSLGVILYELLTGTLPLEKAALRAAGYEAIQRMIREVEPPKPSTRLSRLTESVSVTMPGGSSPARGVPPRPSTALERIARDRGLEPAALRRILRGDLDWITMKALEKERLRRYASPQDLGADISRFLRGDRVTSGARAFGNGLRRMMMRRWRGAGWLLAVGLGAFLVLAVVAPERVVLGGVEMLVAAVALAAATVIAVAGWARREVGRARREAAQARVQLGQLRALLGVGAALLAVTGVLVVYQTNSRNSHGPGDGMTATEPPPSAHQGDFPASAGLPRPAAVRAMIDAYTDLVGELEGRADRLAILQETIGNSWTDYRRTFANSDPDPREFSRFVEASADRGATLDALDKIGVLLQRVEQAAISPDEARTTKERFLNEVVPQRAGMTIAQLEGAARERPRPASSHSAALWFDVDVVKDPGLKGQWVVVDLIGVNNELMLDNYKQYEVNKYFAANDTMRSDSSSKYTMNFKPEAVERLTLRVDDAAWERWNKPKYLVVLASIPGLADKKGEQDPRRKILPLDPSFWAGRRLEILVTRSGVVVLTPEAQRK